MSKTQRSLTEILDSPTTTFLVQYTGIPQNRLIPLIETTIAFLMRLVERSDTFNYYELANLFTKNGRSTNNPDKIIDSLRSGVQHDAILDAQQLLQILLRDEQEKLQQLTAQRFNLAIKQAEKGIFISAVCLNVILGQLMIGRKMNMRAITRSIKTDLGDLANLIDDDLKLLSQKLTQGNTVFDENKIIVTEQTGGKTINYIVAGIGLFIILAIFFKSCVK